MPKLWPGDKVQLTSGFLNSVSDTVHRIGSGEFNRPLPVSGGGYELKPGIVTVRNDTGSDIPMFSAIQPDAPILPDGGSSGITNNQLSAILSNWIVFKGIAPDSNKPFAVLLEPCRKDGIASAIVSGPVVCVASVNNSADTRIKIGSNGQLTTGQDGPIRILTRVGATNHFYGVFEGVSEGGGAELADGVLKTALAAGSATSTPRTATVTIGTSPNTKDVTATTRKITNKALAVGKNVTLIKDASDGKWYFLLLDC